MNQPGIWPTDSGEQKQRRIKARLIAESWAIGGMDAMALGEADWQLGTDFVREIVADSSLPLLAANLVCGGSKPYPSAKVVDLEGMRIGIIGVTVGQIEGCETTDPVAAIRDAVKELGKVDVTIGLLPYDNDRVLVPLLQNGELPVDIIVDARGRYPAAGPEKRGPTWAIGAGSRAKSLGVLHLSLQKPGAPWTAGGDVEKLEERIEMMRSRRLGAVNRGETLSDDKSRALIEAQVATYDRQLAELEQQLAAVSDPSGNILRISQIDIEKSLPEHPKTAAMVQTAKQAITTTSGDDPRKFVPRVVAEGPYAGGEACVGCHTEQHSQWSRSPHARAWQSLVAQNSALDASCWGCHVTGAKLDGGPQTASETAGYRDVQCEACHGPSRAHVADPEGHKAVLDPEPAVCTRCHDGEMDGGRFDFETYRPQVLHTP